MHTEVFKIEGPVFNPEQLQPAVEILKNGGVVGFPTETVYGLGAIATNDSALREIFRVKGRPADNPLILHIWRECQLKELAEEVNEKYRRLIEEFWPGPLTLIFPKRPEVSLLVTAGLGTVAVRMPSHPVARELLRLVDIPVAAPSANLSGSPSPTRGDHVFQDLAGKIPVIIDAGPCQAGLESTVLTLTDGRPLILRPGFVTREMLEETLGERVETAQSGAVDRPRAPGMKYRHYAPRAPVVLVEGENEKVVAKINQIIREEPAGLRIVVIGSSDNARKYRCDRVLDWGPRSDLAIAAARLFGFLRECDRLEAELVIIEGAAAEGIGAAIENRLRKAAGGNVIYVS